MEIQVMFHKSNQIFQEFSPVNPYSANEYLSMREMLKEAEALGIVRDWAIY